MSSHSDLFCPWEDCKDKWFGWQRLKGPSVIPKRTRDYYYFFRCLRCNRAWVQSRKTRKNRTIIEFYQKTRWRS